MGGRREGRGWVGGRKEGGGREEGGWEEGGKRVCGCVGVREGGSVGRMMRWGECELLVCPLLSLPGAAGQG